MSLETAVYIHQLNSGNPSGADRLKEGDDHIRLIKATLKATFPGLTGPLDASVTQAFLNDLKNQLVPVGTIALYRGDTAPTGWAICNGQTVQRSDNSGTITTPDMRGRVPIGASADFTLLQAYGQASRTITTAVGGAHSHPVPLPAHTLDASALAISVSPTKTNVSVTYSVFGSYAGGGTQDAVAAGSNGAPPAINEVAHTHTATASGTISAPAASTTTAQAEGHTHAATIDVTQPSVALTYIMKI